MLKKTLIGIVSLFVGLCTILIIKQNIRYPQSKQTRYDLRDQFEIGPFQLAVTSVESYSLQEFCNIYDLHLPEQDLPEDYNMQVILATLDVKNTADEPAGVESAGVELSSKDFMDSLEFISYSEINSVDPSGIILQPDETREILLPYIEYGTTYGIDEGWMMDQVPLQLSFRLYPEKITVKLNDLW